MVTKPRVALALPGWTATVLTFLSGSGRPVVLSAAFWVTLSLNVLVFVFDLRSLPQLSGGTLPVTVAVVTVAATWLALPWDSRASPWRKLAAPCFMLAVLGLMFVTGSNGSVPLLLLVFANGVFLFGVRWGTVYAAIPLAATFVGVLLLPRRDVWDATWQAAGMALFAALAIGFSATILENRKRRQESEALLAELEGVYAELRSYAGKARELAIAEERARMARDMHDSVGHYLTVIKIGLDNAERFRSARPEQAWSEVAEAKELTQEALAETRRWVRALKPLALDERSGPYAMAALAHSFEGSGVDVRFRVDGQMRELPGETELTLYRALQEGLTNALRHAKARQVVAVLSFGATDVELDITDDGRGAPEGALTGGFGLSSLAERVHGLGGTVSTGDGPERGFMLRIAIQVTA